MSEFTVESRQETNDIPTPRAFLGGRRLGAGGLIAALGLLAPGTPARASDADLLLGFAAAAAGVFHGRCVGAEVVTIELAGARLAATEYTFAVYETFKGDAATTLRFRQVGTPAGGARDLGALVGLPLYRPGAEYVLFLLPAGRLGLTSPAGAGEAAYRIEGSALRPVAAGHLRTVGGARTAAAVVGGTAEVGTLEALRELLRAAGGR